MRILAWPGFALGVLLACHPAAGQELTATVSGSVLDSSGAVVPNASVTLVNAAKSVRAWQGKTNESGLYSPSALPVGSDHILVEAPGFKKARISGVTLQVDQRARVCRAAAPRPASTPASYPSTAAAR
jgi:hypothetical protein